MSISAQSSTPSRNAIGRSSKSDDSDSPPAVASALKVAIYARVSTDGQDKDGSIKTQIWKCREYCQQHGYEIVADYRDEAVSGVTMPFIDRSAAKRLLDNADAFKCVVVYSRSRVGRDDMDTGWTERMLNELGIRLVSATEYFGDDDTGHIGKRITDVMAGWQARVIRKNTMDGRHRKVREGAYITGGRAGRIGSYGLRWVAKGQVEIDDEAAAVIREMVRLVLDEGLSCFGVKQRTGDVRSPNSIYRLLTNPRLCGDVTYAGIPMRCPAIIDRARFDRLQLALSSHLKRASHVTSPAMLGDSLIRCRHCGGIFTHRTKGAYLYYYCLNRSLLTGDDKGHEGVVCTSIRGDLLEPRILNLILDAANDPARIVRDCKARIRRTREDTAGLDKQAAQAQKRQADLTAQRQSVLRWARAGDITEDDMRSQLREITLEQTKARAGHQRLERRRNEVQSVQDDAELLRDMVWKFTIGSDVFDDELFKPAIDAGDREPDDSLALDSAAGSMYSRATRLAMALKQDPKKVVRRFIGQLWVEPDGSLTVEGPGFGASGVITHPSSSRRQSDPHTFSLTLPPAQAAA